MARFYKGVQVGSGALKNALDAGDQKEAAKIFRETGERHAALYSFEDRMWFEVHGRLGERPMPAGC